MDMRFLEWLFRYALIRENQQFLHMVVAARVAEAESNDYRNFVNKLQQDILNLKHGITVEDIARRNREDLKLIGGG